LTIVFGGIIVPTLPPEGMERRCRRYNKGKIFQKGFVLAFCRYNYLLQVLGLCVEGIKRCSLQVLPATFFGGGITLKQGRYQKTEV